MPDFLRAVALEYPSLKFAVVASSEKALARQFQVAKIPSVYSLAQQGTAMSGNNQVSVGAAVYPGGLNYAELSAWCAKMSQDHEKLTEQWTQNVLKNLRQQARHQGAGAGANKPQTDEDEHVDLDKDEL